MQNTAITPCQYRTGRMLGSGTYAIVREAIHINTGDVYACKIINKKLMEGREYLVRNEIAVLKRISSGHPNIVTLHDYFEGSYYEADAAALVRTILTAVNHIHVAASGLRSQPRHRRGKLSLLTEVCGTPGYMAPEIFRNTGHGKPVDIWAMGVAENEAILAGDYKFEPAEYWANVSHTARDFVQVCLTVDPERRPTAAQAWSTKCWLASATPYFVPDPFNPSGGPTDLLPQVKHAFNAKATWKKAGYGIRALNRMAALAGSGDRLAKEAAELSANVQRFKEESAQEVMEDSSIMHHHNT
ncbi:Pkinase-domain-containing protein [Mycena leptocephala]|nr:Pkinase-domain-containing protein [Mycena leptocephala]